MEEFAYSIGVSVQTISRWRQSHPKFSESIERARTASKAYWLKDTRECATNPEHAKERDYRYYQIFVRNVCGLSISDNEARLQLEVDELRCQLDEFFSHNA